MAFRRLGTLSNPCNAWHRMMWTSAEGSSSSTLARHRVLPQTFGCVGEKGLRGLAAVQGDRLVNRSNRPSLACYDRRHLGTAAESAGEEPTNPELFAFTTDTLVYKHGNRMQGMGISAIAIVQTGFWASTAYAATGIVDPLISPLWATGGVGLSLVFVAMVHAYLRRSVAALSVIGTNAAEVRVRTRGFGGYMRSAETIQTKNLVGGPHGDNSKERYWTFAEKRTTDDRPFFFIVDTKHGMLDQAAVAAICSTQEGGSKLMVLAHKRQATEMRRRWNDWEKAKGA